MKIPISYLKCCGNCYFSRIYRENTCSNNIKISYGLCKNWAYDHLIERTRLTLKEEKGNLQGATKYEN